MKTFSKQPGAERTRHVSCALCGSEDRAPLYEYEGFRFCRCNGCRLVYQDPQPLPEDLRNRYDEAYFRYEIENEGQFLDLMLRGLADIGFPDIEARLPEKRFLDIGCATGILLAHMKRSGWETEGVEVCAASVDYGRSRRNLSIFCGTLDEASFPDGSFTFIHLSHLIEHLNDPGTFLDEVFRILAPGGHAAIVTPNIDGFQSRLFGKNWRSAIADHMYLFSPATLGKMLRARGFLLSGMKTWGGLARGTAPAWLKNPVDKAAKVLGMGDVMIVCAVKPGRPEISAG